MSYVEEVSFLFVVLSDRSSLRHRALHFDAAQTSQQRLKKNEAAWTSP